METIYKPVPDVEALRYKGTPGKPDIKIFVSHRIDLDSETIENPLYIPVRCGAVYDEHKNVTMLGDDTGDNISERRMTFNEFTVIYWAWKNVKADYYGVNQYRRYTSFAPKRTYIPMEYYKSGTGGSSVQCLIEDNINKKMKKKYHLNERDMRKQIEENDIITVEEIDLSLLNMGTNYTHMQKNPHSFVSKDFDVLYEIVKQKFPEWIDDFEYYFFKSTKARWYNSFIMSREIFNDYCSWLFDILFEFEKKVDVNNRTEKRMRAAGYMGERLTGLYIFRLIKSGQYRVKENQLVFIINTSRKQKGTNDSFKNLFKKIFPYGSRPYVFIKKIYFMHKRIAYDSRNDLKNRKYDGVLDYIAPVSTKRFMEQMEAIKRIRSVSADALLKSACWANEIRDTHKETFTQYKYCNWGKDIVIVATGPTLAYYDAIKDAKHIGVNSAYKREDIKLDYYFVMDGNGLGRTVEKEKISELDCDKFVGTYFENNTFYGSGFYEMFAKEVGAKTFIASWVKRKEDINRNIEYFPLMNGWSITVPALHFALHTHPKRIFLVGNDASVLMGEHFDKSIGGGQIFVEQIPRIYGWIKAFVKQYYPDIEIISVNPVGLKGMFRDCYTQSYLDAHPEAKQGIGRYYELLEDVVNEVSKEENT